MFWQALALFALLFSVGAFALRLRAFFGLRRPADNAQPKGRPQAGVLYALTLGMAPWAKESTRLHAVAYLRGVGFHLGIFLGLAVLVASPWLDLAGQPVRIGLAVLLGAGALLGLAGVGMRFVEHNLRHLSTPDDFFAPLIVSLFLGSAALWLANGLPAAVYYGLSALMLVYAPFGKIRHCIYFAFSRLFYGRFMGTRAILPHSQQTGSLPAGK